MELLDRDMCPVPLRNLMTGVKIPVDLHVRIGSNKYVAVAKAGTYTQIDRFLSYENKNIDALWIRREDYQRFVGESVAIATDVTRSRELQDQQKNSVLCQAASTVLSEISDLGISLESYEHARKISESTLVMVENNFDLLEAFQSYSNNGLEKNFDHSVGVAMLSVMIAKSHGWQKPATLEKLALGGLLHDIGKRELPPELLQKTRAQMTFDDIALYESHPFRGMELLRSIGVVPDDVLSIVYEHHENAIGQGYPRKLKDVRINPLARIVSLANQFVELATPAHPKIKRRTAREAMQHIEITMGQPFNKEAFRALKNVVLRAASQNAA